MRRGNDRRHRASDQGYTAIELMVVLVIALILVAIAVPPYVQWRNNLQYRLTARAITAMLRDAQSRAIANNQQYRVEFLPPSYTQYRMTQRNLSIGAATWNMAQDWVNIASQATVTIQNLNVPLTENCTPNNNSCIDFYPNGTVSLNNPGTPVDILITDNTGATHFVVEVSGSGRISIRTNL